MAIILYYQKYSETSKAVFDILREEKLILKSRYDVSFQEGTQKTVRGGRENIKYFPEFPA